ncbi:protein C2-DOMAIN ABA-RELATED 10-like [Hibiscus syriacus]|uniref:protein C2-DOMAIN ABA-RELATED 10-like n=1 Tax=Hibiscus syriacus TaxID=106335 RepID=UPI0019233B66|nr:protein C2-DOMAIN ABA-RELATED 10-like [Hibiscus syriacus]
MEDILGLLKINVRRGFDLAVRDAISSDPYVVITIAEQKLKTHVVKRNCNPVWNEVLVFSIKDPHVPVHLTVYDKDTFTEDDRMGAAEVEIQPYIEALKMAKGLHNLPSSCTLKRIQPSRGNCLAEESNIVWENGRITQDMRIKLQDVECGEILLHLDWTETPGCKGLEGEAIAGPWNLKPPAAKKQH